MRTRDCSAAMGVAVVTGGASGIGEAIVRRLAADGYAVAIGDLDFEGATAVADELCGTGIVAMGARLDVASRESVERFFDKVEKELGPCRALVNNAGIAGAQSLDDLDPDIWERTIAVNLTGALLMSRRAVRGMKMVGAGRIVNLSSISGVRASFGRTSYGTSKTALIGLTRQLAIELASERILVNAVAPGPIETPLVKALHTDGMRSNFIHGVPMHRYGTPAEVASVVSFLCSEDASYVTGVLLPVDGGFLTAGVLAE